MCSESNMLDGGWRQNSHCFTYDTIWPKAKLHLFHILDHDVEEATFPISNFVTRIFVMSSSTKSVYRRHNTTVRGHKIKMENAFSIA